MIRIGFVESYPHVIAGQQKTLLSLLKRASEHDIEPVVIVPGEGEFAEHLRQLGYLVEVVPYPESLGRYGGAIYRDGLLKRLSVVGDVCGYVRRARKLLRTLRLQAMFCNDMRGLLTVGVAAKSARIPSLIWDKLDKPHGRLDAFQLPLVKRNAIISHPVAEKYPAWQRKLYRRRIVRIPNGVDFDRFQNVSAIRETLGYESDDVVFGIIGTVTERKAHDLLLGAFARIYKQHPKVHVLAVGSWDDSPEDQAFYETLSEMNLPRVSFLGKRHDIPQVMHSIDVLVLPSRHEGLGQVSLEAMACGKPVIGSRVGGIQETVVDGNTGLLFDSENVDQLADAMQRLAEDVELRKKMGVAGRARVQTEYNRVEKMDAICRMLIEIAQKRTK